VSTQAPNFGPAREVALFRDYLDKHPYGAAADSFTRAHDEQYFRLTQLGNWLSDTVRIVAGGTDGTPRARLARLVAAQERYEAAYTEITTLFTQWLPTAEPATTG
jgi:hypothetical protein